VFHCGGQALSTHNQKLFGDGRFIRNPGFLGRIFSTTNDLFLKQNTPQLTTTQGLYKNIKLITNRRDEILDERSHSSFDSHSQRILKRFAIGKRQFEQWRTARSITFTAGLLSSIN
jgi:hypothetical protein